MQIRRRGEAGAILNSKSEFDRCRITRLVIEEEDEIKIREQENRELEQDWNKIEDQAREWEDQTLIKRSKDDQKKWSSQMKTTVGQKREQEGLQGARKRRKIRSYKHEILGADWGEQKTPKEPGSDPISTDDQLEVSAPSIQQPPRGIGGGGDPVIEHPLTSPVIEDPLPVREPPSLKQLSLGDIPGWEKITAVQQAPVQCEESTEDDKFDSFPAPSMEQSTKTPSSDSTGKQMEICKPDKRGRCLQHKCDMKKFSVSSKKWVDRGGGKGFGWKQAKVTKYRCLNKERITVGQSVEINPGRNNLSDGYGRANEHFERESFYH